jgi:RNA polymerase sigma-70 factor, ECF subfamily
VRADTGSSALRHGPAGERSPMHTVDQLRRRAGLVAEITRARFVDRAAQNWRTQATRSATGHHPGGRVMDVTPKGIFANVTSHRHRTVRITMSMPIDLPKRCDADLVAAAVTGDGDAFAELVARHQDDQFRTALRLTGSRDDAHDALQSAFVRGHRHLASCEDPARFGAWLGRIVLNECRTLLVRRTQRERRLVQDDALLANTAAPASYTDDDWREEIERALGQLPDEQREAFLLKYVEDRSYEEIAELTGAGVSALKMRVKRACERLRLLLEPVHHG